MRNLTRRHALVLSGGFTLSAVAHQAFGQTAQADTLSLYVGTYDRDGKGGVYGLTYAAKTDQWSLGAHHSDIHNASFAAASPRIKGTYVLNEQDEGQVTFYNAQWQALKTVTTHGQAPCYTATDATGTCLGIANYSSGNVVFYRLDANGLPVSDATIRQNSGHGPNADRQSGPHAHWVGFSPENDRIYSVDLGTDQVLTYTFDSETGMVGKASVAYAVAPGSGPRHMIFHPDGKHAYLVTELHSTVLTLKREPDGTLTELQTLSCLPAGYTDPSFSAHIALNADGSRLYVSNRGHNSIAVFKVADGQLSLMQIIPTEGNWPRFFILLEDVKRVIVAHERGDNLIVFGLNADGSLGRLKQRLSVSAPVFIGRQV
ncbi:MAG: lactonase family protein [Asticcacaulis sp.]